MLYWQPVQALFRLADLSLFLYLFSRLYSYVTLMCVEVYGRRWFQITNIDITSVHYHHPFISFYLVAMSHNGGGSGVIYFFFHSQYHSSRKTKKKKKSGIYKETMNGGRASCRLENADAVLNFNKNTLFGERNKKPPVHVTKTEQRDLLTEQQQQIICQVFAGQSIVTFSTIWCRIFIFWMIWVSCHMDLPGDNYCHSLWPSTTKTNKKITPKTT